jgi:thiol-disulfide isomerase/thioredoxin
MKKSIVFLYSFLSIFFISCNEEYTLVNTFESISLITEDSSKLINQPFVFFVKNDNNDDVTAEATIFVNGVAIEGNTFVSNSVGSYEVTAEYLGIQSQLITINYFDGTEVNFVKRVLIEDFTGTWCGFCPRVTVAIDRVNLRTDKAVAVAIHRASSNPTSNNYDPFNFDASELENLINIPGYPKATLNRITQWNFPETSNASINQAVAMTQGDNPKLGLAISSTLENNQLQLRVRAKFSNTFTNTKLVVYILENGLIYDQYNYTSHYGGVHPLVNFTHNHVLRECLTPLLGEAINNSISVPAGVYEKNYSIPLPSSIANGQNIEFVAFVVDSNNRAINVRKAAVNVTQDFEEL